MKSRLLPFLTMALVCISLPLLATTERLDKSKLLLQGNRISLDSPIIKKDGTVLVPLRDLLNHLDIPLEYSRRKDEYSFLFNKSKFILYPHTRDILKNNSREYLTSASTKYQNRLYIPLKSLSSLIGYDVTENGSDYILEKQTLQSTLKKAISINNLIDRIDLFHISPPQKPKLPKLNEKETFHLGFELRHYDLSQKFIHKNRILYTDLSDILPKEGFTYTPIENGIVIKKGLYSVTFFNNKSEVAITRGNDTYTKGSQGPPITENKRTYLPFKDVINAFDLTTHWEPKDRTLTLLNTIREIQIIQDDQGLKLTILASQGLSASIPVEIDFSNGFSIDLDFAQVPKSYKQNIISKTSIAALSIKNKDELTAELKVFLTKKSGYFPLSSTEFGGEILFHNAITSLTEKNSKKEISYIIKGNGNFKYNYWRSEDKKKVIVDIPDSINQLPLILMPEHESGVHKIRTSQFKESPPITRVVFDLIDPKTEPKIQKEGDHLTLVFPAEYKEKITAPEPPIKPTKAAPSTYLSKAKTKRPLENKIIVIDPGHGGSDPGAVVQHNVYEKFYTLDTSKRLQQLLEKDGAFVIMLRKNDSHVSLKTRAIIANKNKADLLISLHYNSFVKPTAQGTETYYYKNKDIKLSKAVHSELVKALNLQDNGIKKARMYILRTTTMPGTLVEPLFLTNSKEFKLVNTPEYREKVAGAIHKGILKYYGK